MNKASNQLIDAGIDLATMLSSAFRATGTIYRILRGGRLQWDDLILTVPVIGGAIMTIRSGLSAWDNHQEVHQILLKLNNLQGKYEALQGTIKDLKRQFDDNNCEQIYS